MILESQNLVGEGEEEIQRVIERLLDPSSASSAAPGESASPLGSVSDQRDDQSVTHISNIVDPIQGILTGETEPGHPGGWAPWVWPTESVYAAPPGYGAAELSAERWVAASLAYLATKIVGSTLPKETQEALVTSPPSSLAEARSLMSLLQSQPRRRGRPRKNYPPPDSTQLKRPRGRPRKRPLPPPPTRRRNATPELLKGLDKRATDEPNEPSETNGPAVTTDEDHPATTSLTNENHNNSSLVGSGGLAMSEEEDDLVASSR